MWTLALVADSAFFLRGYGDAPRFVVLLLGVMALFRPRPALFAATWASSVVAWIALAPLTTNHSFSLALGSVLALVCGDYRRGERGTRAWVFPLVFAVYLASVVQKFNSTYLFDVDASCAVEVWEQFVSVPRSVAWVLPPGSLLIELGLGVGLWWARSRRAVVWVGLLFHFFLGIQPVSPIVMFTLTMVALYTAGWDDRDGRMVPFVRAAALVSIAGWLVRLMGSLALGTAVAWLAWLVVLPGLVLLFRQPLRTDEAPPRPTWVMAAALLVPLLNLVPAHTGDRQFNSFDMYSNLEVTPGESNHLLMPSLDRPRPFNRRVRVLSAEPDRFPFSRAAGDRVAALELARVIRAGQLEQVRWTEDGVISQWSAGEPLPFPEISTWDLRFRRLRPLAPGSVCVDCPSCRLDVLLSD